MSCDEEHDLWLIVLALPCLVGMSSGNEGLGQECRRGGLCFILHFQSLWLSSMGTRQVWGTRSRSCSLLGAPLRGAGCKLLHPVRMSVASSQLEHRGNVQGNWNK